MPRYVALLRGVSPMNAKMAQLKRAFERAGFGKVRTVLSSGNVVFDSRAASNRALARKAEKAMQQHLGRSFLTIVRAASELQDLLDSDPWAAFRLPAEAKRVVTFLPAPAGSRLKLPIEKDGARILAMTPTEILTAYLPSPRGPVFMSLIEKTFGKDLTTRTWDTVRKCAAA
jgi:uncharacterized protein (DUF1697 family)